ncbi:Thiol:disulfide interchange protein DsbD precursor [bacterium YEK0313]|nr:Thiol:disulfide interchange protein DsbD precursor [bacterium YEK0313]
MPAFLQRRQILARLLVFAALFLFAAPAGAAPAPADQIFRLAVSRTADGGLALTWTIRAGNHLYRDKFAASLDGRGVAVEMPPGEAKDDPNFGLVEVYHGTVAARIAAPLPAAGALRLTWQGCAEQGICYPPVTRALDLATLAQTDVAVDLDALAAGGSVAAAPPTAAAGGAEALAPVANEASPALLAGRLLPMLAAFFGFGLLLALTPCIFPMIPILSGMLARTGETLSAGRGFVLSSTYVLAIAGSYALVGLAAAWSGQNLQAALQTPFALGLTAAVFVLLALSMFGLFELGLPSWLQPAGTGRRRGTIAGAAGLGFGSALIVGPCLTPPLAAALLYVAQTGDALRGAAALFMLGLGMGLPLVVFGTLGGRFLPKSGAWLVRVRQGFGIVFLGIGLTLVTRLLPPTETLGLYGLTALTAGVFLGAFDRLVRDAGVLPRLGKAAGIAAVLYGTALILGFAAGATDPLRPLVMLARSGAAPAPIAVTPVVVTAPAGFDTALAEARKQSRPVLVSFTADWCTVCRSNERIMAEPAVAARLARLAVIKADVTAYDARSRALMRRFDVVGPPTLILLDAAGVAAGPAIVGAIQAQDFARRLDQAAGAGG